MFWVLLVALPVLGLLIRRWSAVLLPLIAWPTYYIGLNRGWWGCCGTGDAWQAAALAVTLLGVLTTAAGVVVGRMVAGHLADHD